MEDFFWSIIKDWGPGLSFLRKNQGLMSKWRTFLRKYQGLRSKWRTFLRKYQGLRSKNIKFSKIQNSDENSKMSKWPYLQFPRVQNSKSRKIQKIIEFPHFYPRLGGPICMFILRSDAESGAPDHLIGFVSSSWYERSLPRHVPEDTVTSPSRALNC